MLEDLISEDSILERVDAYSIYSFYIGQELEVGRPYNSVLRPDDDPDILPSFALFTYGKTLLFKDHGLGISGNVFKFVKLRFGFDTHLQALSRINVDFELELSGGVPCEKSANIPKLIATYTERPKVKDISVVSKKVLSAAYKSFWREYDVTSKTLNYYETVDVSIVYFTLTDNKVITFYPKTLCIGYPIYDKFKTYMPYEQKPNRFKNNYPPNYVEGFLQLKFVLSFCIITKSTKEIIFFREHFDWDTVAGKSESALIPRHMMLKLAQKFKYLFVWMDNDIAGQKAQLKYMQEYPFLIPIYYLVERKDPTDMYKFSTDKQKVLNEIKTLIISKL